MHWLRAARPALVDRLHLCVGLAHHVVLLVYNHLRRLRDDTDIVAWMMMAATARSRPCMMLNRLRIHEQIILILLAMLVKLLGCNEHAAFLTLAVVRISHEVDLLGHDYGLLLAGLHLVRMISLSLRRSRSLSVVEVGRHADDHLAIATNLELLFHLHLLLNQYSLLILSIYLLLLLHIWIIIVLLNRYRRFWSLSTVCAAWTVLLPGNAVW